MSRMRGPRSTARSARAAQPPLIIEAIERFVRVLARTGMSPRALTTAFCEACERLPEAFVHERGREMRDMIDAEHALTVWYSDPDFLDSHGAPLALSARGRRASLVALARRVDPALDPSEAIAYLLKVNALRRVGARYVPRGRDLRMRGTGAPVHKRNLRPLLGMLRALEHNGRPREEARAWFEELVENPRVPVRKLAEIDARLERLGGDFARSMDTLMHRAERARRADEPTVRLGIGVYRFDDEPQTADPPLRSARGAQKGRRPKTRLRSR